jgi:polysaccharide biosynthesis protein PslG
MSAGTSATLSPADMEALAAGVASRARGIATAYEVFNEPNLEYEWGGTPDPARYAQLLAAARRGVKRADPDALVIAAGLAPHTGNAPGTLEDVDFLRGMYAAGARGHFDVLGIHPYGGNTAPDVDPAACGICFRRAELYRRVMVEHGDSATPAWVTEFGYLHTTGLDLGQYNWLKLTPEQQGSYLTSAFRYGYEQWPWLAGMVAFNLDFDTVPWNPPQLGAYWFALLNPDRSPRPAYVAMRDLAKPGAAAPLPVSSAAVSAASPPAPAPAPAPAAAPQPVQPARRPTVVTTQPATQNAADVVCRTTSGKAVCGPVAALAATRK